jgi:pilus assembly protein CpaB
LLLLFAGGIILFTIMLLRSRLTEQPVAAPAPAASVRIVIAKRDLAVGSFVQGNQDLDWGSPPEPAAQVITNPLPEQPQAENPDAPDATAAQSTNAAPREAYLYEGSVKLTDFNGAIVRRALHAGDPVPQFAIMKSGEGGFMSAVLEPGMRAVSIGVNPTSGNGGFVSPGDRVDLIVTHRVKAPQEPNAPAADEFVVSETFVRNSRVVAVDQMTENPENKAILAKTITVEVSPRNAEAIAVAADLGKISISLRSLSSPDGKVADTNQPAEGAEKEVAKEVVIDGLHSEQASGYTRDSDISELLLNHKPTGGSRVHVVRGDKSENMDFNQDKK